MNSYQQQLEAEYNRLLKQERDNMRRKRISYRIALILFAGISIGLGLALMYGLKERVDVRELQKDQAHQSQVLDHQLEITEEREYQLSKRDSLMANLKQQLVESQMECNELRQKIERGVAPIEYTVCAEDSTRSGCNAYYRQDGQWIQTQAYYPNGYTLYVYTRIGEFMLTDYGFFPYYNLERR